MAGGIGLRARLTWTAVALLILCRAGQRELYKAPPTPAPPCSPVLARCFLLEKHPEASLAKAYELCTVCPLYCLFPDGPSLMLSPIHSLSLFPVLLLHLPHWLLSQVSQKCPRVCGSPFCSCSSAESFPRPRLSRFRPFPPMSPSQKRPPQNTLPIIHHLVSSSPDMVCELFI